MNLQEKAETRVPEFRLDQRGKDREQNLKSLPEGLGSSPAPGQKQGADSRKARETLRL